MIAIKRTTVLGTVQSDGGISASDGNASHCSYRVVWCTRQNPVESRCGAVALVRFGCGRRLSWRRHPCDRTITPFPHPAHRTGRADFPHPALGQDITPSPTTHRVQAESGVRVRNTRKDATRDMPHLGVAWSCACYAATDVTALPCNCRSPDTRADTSLP